jgi:hypothetical protein
MRGFFTEQDLLNYLYRESDVLERFEIEAALESSTKLRRRFNFFKKAKQVIPKVLFSPSDKCMDEVLNYSRGAVSVC